MWGGLCRIPLAVVTDPVSYFLQITPIWNLGIGLLVSWGDGMHRVPTLMSLTTAKECCSADFATNTEAASFFGVECVSSVDCARFGRGGRGGLGAAALRVLRARGAHRA